MDDGYIFAWEIQIINSESKLLDYNRGHILEYEGTYSFCKFQVDRYLYIIPTSRQWRQRSYLELVS